MIPKIIHQTAPQDRRNWHPIWKFCQESWKQQYPKEDFTHIFWNDGDNDKFIRTEFPEYYQLYQDFGNNVILKVDFVRYAILYKYGGIYADMDIFFNKNFYSMLDSNICIVQALCSREIVQNSLMASVPGDKRWLDVMQNCKDYYYEYKMHHRGDKIHSPDIIDISGPRLLSRALNMELIQILPRDLFNPTHSLFKSDAIYTKHYLTGRWGPSSGIKVFDQDLIKNDPHLSLFYADSK